MFDNEASSVPMCTIRRNPTGGYSPVLHLSHQPPPVPAPTALSLPTVDDAARYARDHYGTGMIRIGDECVSRTSNIPGVA